MDNIKMVAELVLAVFRRCQLLNFLGNPTFSLQNFFASQTVGNMILKAFTMMFCFVACLSVPAAAGQLDDGHNAFVHQNYPRALHLLRPIAAQGDA
jgi:hypothetical protein